MHVRKWQTSSTMLAQRSAVLPAAQQQRRPSYAGDTMGVPAWGSSNPEEKRGGDSPGSQQSQQRENLGQYPSVSRQLGADAAADASGQFAAQMRSVQETIQEQDRVIQELARGLHDEQRARKSLERAMQEQVDASRNFDARIEVRFSYSIARARTRSHGRDLSRIVSAVCRSSARCWTTRRG